ncbi:hypothetical protein GCM10010377_00190 [Streptomyces viridiviolaceus]|uniref:Uncharacterized protein n=1 Tax=Streptomyces viridiviolaceus TaxID=68282 RepID=A0ABW2DYN9_9ACTN|nr:hypothetical protein [Streptomyces viridiviolaceus]GHB15031.1 hypothetical protein GCM10010377_00190 [Streptomyces viridiviolaceus]
MRDVAIIEAPSVPGLRPSGVEELPDALLGAGPATGLGALRAGRVEPPPYAPERDRATGVLNPAGVAAYTVPLVPVGPGRRGLSMPACPRPPIAAGQGPSSSPVKVHRCPSPRTHRARPARPH